jgi:hypothetical protein
VNDVTSYDLRLSEDQLKQLEDAESALKESQHAHERMREVCFSSEWWTGGRPSDPTMWAMDVRKLTDDAGKFVCRCIDVVAIAARSFGAVEPFRESLARMAADVEKRALAIIDPRDRPLLEPHISQVAADRVSKWLTWAERELKPAWMTSSRPEPDDINPDRQATTEVRQTTLGRNIDRLRKECGWSFDGLATATGLDKKLILGHVNEGKGFHPKTLAIYAAAFRKKLGRPVSVAEIEG